MPKRQTRSLAILSHRGVDTLRTGAAITLWPSWRHAYIRRELACETELRRGKASVRVHREGRGRPRGPGTKTLGHSTWLFMPTNFTLIICEQIPFSYTAQYCCTLYLLYESK